MPYRGRVDEGLTGSPDETNIPYNPVGQVTQNTFTEDVDEMATNMTGGTPGNFSNFPNTEPDGTPGGNLPQYGPFGDYIGPSGSGFQAHDQNFTPTGYWGNQSSGKYYGYQTTPEILDAYSGMTAGRIYDTAHGNIDDWGQRFDFGPSNIPGAQPTPGYAMNQQGMPNYDMQREPGITPWVGSQMGVPSQHVAPGSLESAAQNQMMSQLGGPDQFNLDKFFGQDAMDAIGPSAQARMDMFKGLTAGGFRDDMSSVMNEMGSRGITSSGITGMGLGEAVTRRGERRDAYASGMMADELSRYGQMGLAGHGLNLQGYGLGMQGANQAMGFGMGQTGRALGQQWDAYGAHLGEAGRKQDYGWQQYGAELGQIGRQTEQDWMKYGAGQDEAGRKDEYGWQKYGADTEAGRWGYGARQAEQQQGYEDYMYSQGVQQNMLNQALGLQTGTMPTPPYQRSENSAQQMFASLLGGMPQGFASLAALLG